MESLRDRIDERSLTDMSYYDESIKAHQLLNRQRFDEVINAVMASSNESVARIFQNVFKTTDVKIPKGVMVSYGPRDSMRGGDKVNKNKHSKKSKHNKNNNNKKKRTKRLNKKMRRRS